MANRGKDGRWLPGKSANEGGRPKNVRTRAKEAMEKYGLDPFEFLASVVLDNKEKMNHRIDATKELLNRAYGKAPQYIENKIDSDDKEITIKIIDTPEQPLVSIEADKKRPKAIEDGSNVIDITPTGTDPK